MSSVIRIEWMGGLVGTESIHSGQYVKSFDPDAFDGRGYLVTVKDKQTALKFESAAAALEFYRRSSTVHPVRKSDGKPNRPLTAFSVSIEPFDKEEGE